MTEQPYPLPHQIMADAGAAFTCDFAISTNISPVEIVPMIERDRTFMTVRPGFLRKFIPLRSDPASGNLLSGGRYLFRTAQDARQYQSWLWHDFVLDGVAFFDRPFFSHPECHVWDVVGVADLAPYDERQVVLRTERFRVLATSQDVQLAALEQGPGRGPAPGADRRVAAPRPARATRLAGLLRRSISAADARLA